MRAAEGRRTVPAGRPESFGGLAGHPLQQSESYPMTATQQTTRHNGADNDAHTIRYRQLQIAPDTIVVTDSYSGCSLCCCRIHGALVAFLVDLDGSNPSRCQWPTTAETLSTAGTEETQRAAQLKARQRPMATDHRRRLCRG